MKRRDFVSEFLVGGTLLGTRGSLSRNKPGLRRKRQRQPSTKAFLSSAPLPANLTPAKYSQPSSRTPTMSPSLRVAPSPNSSAKDTRAI